MEIELLKRLYEQMSASNALLTVQFYSKFPQKKKPRKFSICTVFVIVWIKNQPFIASSTATAHATVAPTIGLLPICLKSILLLFIVTYFYLS